MNIHDVWLDFRKKQINRVKSALSLSRVESYAINFRDHFKKFFGNNKHVQTALSWQKLDMSARAVHAVALVKHALEWRGYSDVVVRVAAAGAGVGGYTTGREVVIAERTLESDNYDKLVDVATHEVTHVNQIKDAGTTLDSETVRTCEQNYIDGREDYNGYRENPIEAEAFAVGERVSRNFTARLKRLVQEKKLSLAL